MKKGILSLATLGLLASPLTLGTVHAEENGYNLSKKMIERQDKKPLQTGILDLHTINHLEKEIKYSQSSSVKSFNKMNTMSTMGIMRNSTSSDDDFIFEVEPNEEFENADNTSYEKPLLGQLLSSDEYYDYDLHKVVVPKDGLLYVAGVANSDNIDLSFAAWEKDYVESDRLEYLDNWEEEGIEYQVYQAKAGTYYVEVYDYDEDEDIDNNTEDDQYLIATEFEDNVAPSKPTVNKVDNNDVVVTGKAEASSTVTVKNGSTVLGTGTATSTGTYSVKISAAQKAGVTLSVYAKDSAGNTGVAGTTKVVDVIAPAKPTVNRVDNNDVVVTGKAEAGSTVAIKRGTTTLATVKATSTGTFSAKIAVQLAGTKLTVTAKDAAGNTSVANTVTVVDGIPPGKPTINKVDDNDLKVTGKAEKGSIVTVKKGTTVLGTATTNTSGVYSVSIKAQKKGTVISVTAKDKAGNTSAATTYTVVKH
ncbi:Ig-like domain-containing protein [Gottfriedia acidiceleris]|uniref:Ig-like domain-containing protein n=1 Tax=Gottfriedia acidiceleris TaxID=371036 RepID=UPI000B438D13|nr:Ig-like domain-containing protein [Gottfriedia acidiceleris]